MPNDVVNELIFTGLTDADKDRVLAAALNEKGEIDFEVLVPVPLNLWWGNAAEIHEKKFGGTALDWQRRNWGTKWNAYSQRPIVRTDEELRLIFDTAWRPPYAWLAALVNKTGLSFHHNWLDEGCEKGVHAEFRVLAEGDIFGPVKWFEAPCDDAVQARLNDLHGVEA